MNRLLFEKTGKAIYISHLDTMAMFPRIFLRAGLHVKFTRGMSPHAYVSIALPLSVGTSSCCELLDFTLEEDNVPLETLPARLNPYFPAGIRVLSAYDSDRKIKELRYLRCTVTLEYDQGISDDGCREIEALFHQDQILVEKKTKKGLAETDIRPMIYDLQVTGDHQLSCTLALCEAATCKPELLLDALSAEAGLEARPRALCVRTQLLGRDFTPLELL